MPSDPLEGPKNLFAAAWLDFVFQKCVSLNFPQSDQCSGRALPQKIFRGVKGSFLFEEWASVSLL